MIMILLRIKKKDERKLKNDRPKKKLRQAWDCVHPRDMPSEHILQNKGCQYKGKNEQIKYSNIKTKVDCEGDTEKGYQGGKMDEFWQRTLSGKGRSVGMEGEEYEFWQGK